MKKGLVQRRAKAEREARGDYPRRIVSDMPSSKTISRVTEKVDEPPVYRKDFDRHPADVPAEFYQGIVELLNAGEPVEISFKFMPSVINPIARCMDEVEWGMSRTPQKFSIRVMHSRPTGGYRYEWAVRIDPT